MLLCGGLTNKPIWGIKRQMPITLERTPIEKQIYAKVLFDNGNGIGRVRKLTGLANDTLYEIQRNQTYSPTILEEFKKRLPFKAYRLADNVADLITLEEIQKAPLGVKMMAFGVAIDKARDMEGSNRPVFNIVTVVNETKTALSHINAQISAIQARKLALSTANTNVVV